MPYNTTAIPPRKEVTGQTQLPLSRVKKIIAQDQDINICSNNAAFVITLATEMFIQYLSTESLNMARADRKPRRNIQYKDLAGAVSHTDNLEFLEDIIPKTAPYKQIKAQAARTRAQLGNGATPSGGSSSTAADQPDDNTSGEPITNGVGSGSGCGSKKHRSSTSRSSLNGGGGGGGASFVGASGARIVSEDEGPEMDPTDQLRSEMRQARGQGDVHMTG
ncbi:histone-fold-containing protein [Hypoxylon rubiginosum]|uniref:Histone-fold-containing protein n=1 Tax=Hypoxylon rubiginosum TaxID=110542 RepID=A0ACB9Z2M6_9PEZI|nr:histone-fold-containing protein [Hypoxylon rubiginosum]